ncbi:MAG TPA: polysaccharide deacetylase family protein [Solirubrobacterales bacterium]|nr:polysaccharide deacetylase family protein [Solirubrobacterales bacterium]
MADAPDDPQGLAVHPDRFSGHLEALLASGRPVVDLADLANAVSRGRIPRGAVAISFDDGYADNLSNAVPRLAGTGLPATVFVASGWVGTRRMAWWDELALQLLATPTAPATFVGAGRSWATGSPAERGETYRVLLEESAGMAAPARDALLEELRAWAGRDGAAGEDMRALSDAELIELSGRPGITIGAHTRHHPSLARRPPAEQAAELRAGREDLADRLGSAPALFAYPFGARGRDYDHTTVRAVAAAGFVAAVATDPGPVSRLSPRLELPRILIGDLEPEAFAARLRRAFAL